MNRVALLCLAVGFPLLTQAADNPRDVIQAREYNQAACVQKATDDCVNTMCANSSARDCPDTCKQSAQAKCEVSSRE